MKKFIALLSLLMSTAVFAQNVNFSNATPAAPSGYANIQWQHDASSPVNLSGYYPVAWVPPVFLSSAPSGLCSTNNQVAFVTGSGAPYPQYVCNSGTWAQSGGSSYTLPIATTSTLGGVKPDGTTTTVNPSTGVITAIGSGGSSPFPSSFPLAVEGASLTQGVDIQQEVGFSTMSPGSGYTAGSTCTTSISGLTGTTQPTVGAYVDAAGHVQWSLTSFGTLLSGTGIATVTGGCGAGSGASATLTVPASTCTIIGGTDLCYNNAWPKQLTTLSAMNGRVASFTNYAEGGSNITDAISRATSNNYAAFCAASANQYFLVGGDLAFNSMSSYGSHPNLTAQVAYAQWISFVHYLKNNGCKVIVTTPNIGSTYAGGVGSSMSGAFVNRVQTFAQLVRNGKQGTDYDYLIDITSALQTNTDPTFFANGASDFTHWTLSGDTMVAGYANNALLAGGGPGGNLAPYYNLPVAVDTSGAVNWSQQACTGGESCFNIVVGNGLPFSITSLQTNQLSGAFFKDGATGTIQGHVGYVNGTGGGLGGNLVELGVDSGGSAAGVDLYGPGGSAYLLLTNQIILHSSVVEIPEQAAGSGHDCAQFDTSGILTNTGFPCSSGGGSGTVTSVALKSASPNLFSGTAGTAVTSSGFLDPDAQLATQSANCIVSGPSSGSAAKPTCRALVTADVAAVAAPPVACTTVSSLAPANGGCYKLSTSASAATPAASAFSIFKITTASGATATLTGTTIADGGNCSAYISGTTFALTGVETAVINSDGTNVWATCTAASSYTLPNATTSTLGGVIIGAGLGVSSGTVSLNAQYKTWSCQPGIGDGFDNLAIETFPIMECWNTTGVAITINAISCYTDAGTSTLQVADYNGTTFVANILSSAVACAAPAAAGTISGSTYSLANGHNLKFTYAVTGADGTQATWIVGGTY